MLKKRGEPTAKDRRRFAFEKAGELWMSDVMHGPTVTVAGRQRKTYLLALIDDATRLVPYAAFALSENASAFLTVLEQAIRRRGIPKRIYVDNGAAFRAQHLALVCAKLGITLIHARPYTPQGIPALSRTINTSPRSLRFRRKSRRWPRPHLTCFRANRSNTPRSKTRESPGRRRGALA